MKNPPITIATTNEYKNARIFLIIVDFLPKYLISTGIVITPTIINDETKAAICIYPAPYSKRAFARGKATNPGISVIAPIKEAIITPNHPDFFL